MVVGRDGTGGDGDLSDNIFKDIFFFKVPSVEYFFAAPFTH